MPSLFETQLTSNLGQVYSAVGLAASYTPPDGSGTITTGLDGNALVVRRIMTQPIEVERPTRASGFVQSGTLIFRQSQIPTPMVGGRVMVNTDEAWTIKTVPESKNGQYYCQATREGTQRIMPSVERSNG